MKILALIIIIILYFGGNYYMFLRMWQAIPPNVWGRAILIATMAVSILASILAMVAADALPLGLAKFCYSLGTAWIFILLYFVIAFLVKDLIALANKGLHFMPSDALSRYTTDNWVGLGFMVGFIALFMLCGYLKYNWKVRVEQPITISKSIGATDSLTIVAISDLHLGYGIGTKELKEWVKKINNENPDIVIIAGDIVDISTRPLIEDNMAVYFKDINAPIYMCLGNHEYISGIEESLEFIKKTGIHLLRDSHTQIDSTCYIVGRDDKSNPKRKTLSELTITLDKIKPIILLDHQPYDLDEAVACGIDFQFSGHTHQGQVWPISSITKLLYEKDHGYLKKGNTNFFVSSGIGIWGGKFRIGTQSEYIVVKMKKG